MHTTALLVNVHKADQDVLQQLLAQAGYDVLRSKTSDEALELCRDYKGRIHLLVTDAEAPGTSGWELAERATALRPGIVILYIPETLAHSGAASPSPRRQLRLEKTRTLKKANLLFDVTRALIHRTQQDLQ